MARLALASLPPLLWAAAAAAQEAGASMPGMSMPAAAGRPASASPCPRY